MKIAAPQQISRGFWSSAWQSGPGTTSFAELIEQGQNPSTITDHRALGFAETGMLGLHFATSSKSDSADGRAVSSGHQPGKSDHTADANHLTGKVVSPEMKIATKDASRVPAAFLPSDWTVATPKVQLMQFAQEPTLPPETAGDSPLPVIDEPMSPSQQLPTLLEGTSDEADNAQFLMRARQALEKALVPEAELRIKILGNINNITVVIEGFEAAGESQAEIEFMLRQVAKEYGVTIGKLVVSLRRHASGNWREKGWLRWQ